MSRDGTGITTHHGRRTGGMERRTGTGGATHTTAPPGHHPRPTTGGIRRPIRAHTLGTSRVAINGGMDIGVNGNGVPTAVIRVGGSSMQVHLSGNLRVIIGTRGLHSWEDAPST